MPQNKKESLIYTVLMCSFMVFIMSVYNVSLHEGFSGESIQKAWLGFPLAFIIAFICDWFIISGPAKKLAFQILKPEDIVIKKVIIISSCMVCGMVIMMSLFGAVENAGVSSGILLAWLQNIPRNLILAFPLQILIAGPIVRFLFRRAFPVGTIIEI
jgi:hypothetical protein